VRRRCGLTSDRLQLRSITRLQQHACPAGKQLRRAARCATWRRVCPPIGVTILTACPCSRPVCPVYRPPGATSRAAAAHRAGILLPCSAPLRQPAAGRCRLRHCAAPARLRLDSCRGAGVRALRSGDDAALAAAAPQLVQGPDGRLSMTSPITVDKLVALFVRVLLCAAHAWCFAARAGLGHVSFSLRGADATPHCRWWAFPGAALRPGR
jgi:hypothetical protein